MSDQKLLEALVRRLVKTNAIPTYSVQVAIEATLKAAGR